jgi:hypothetical protein
MAIVKYANAYLTDRLYGGPEEGGWYYDVGEPVMSLPFLANEEPREDNEFPYDEMNRNYAFRKVHALCEAASISSYVPALEYLERRDWKVDGFAIYIEDKPGEYFPQKRPHWDMGEDY